MKFFNYTHDTTGVNNLVTDDVTYIGHTKNIIGEAESLLDLITSPSFDFDGDYVARLFLSFEGERIALASINGLGDEEEIWLNVKANEGLNLKLELILTCRKCAVNLEEDISYLL